MIYTFFIRICMKFHSIKKTGMMIPCHSEWYKLQDDKTDQKQSSCSQSRLLCKSTFCVNEIPAACCCQSHGRRKNKYNTLPVSICHPRCQYCQKQCHAKDQKCAFIAELWDVVIRIIPFSDFLHLLTSGVILPSTTLADAPVALFILA